MQGSRAGGIYGQATPWTGHPSRAGLFPGTHLKYTARKSERYLESKVPAVRLGSAGTMFHSSPVRQKKRHQARPIVVKQPPTGPGPSMARCLESEKNSGAMAGSSWSTWVLKPQFDAIIPTVIETDRCLPSRANRLM